MKAKLYHRHYGLHTLVYEVEIEGSFGEYCKLEISKQENLKNNIVGEDFSINEKKLLEELPSDFLPTEASNVLLTIDNKDRGTGQRGLKIFKNWAKYFDSYVLSLINPN